ncbi:MAG TPA: alkaline phosphatase family protein [Verrucomicrobiae bacterium]|jgi:hypothetical protein|nr:alkaline phosphatase family protein [Verrucomicrobiae bacterium]
MKSVLPVFILVDACGWEIMRERTFLPRLAPERKKLNSVFGYSSTCVPSILSGRWPDEHRNWCYYVYDPAHSPFKSLSVFRWLPRALTSRRIFRRWLTKALRNGMGFEGYFDLYNVPFEHIGLYNFTERKSPLRPQGMNSGPNIFDFLVKENISYFGSDPDKGEAENYAALLEAIGTGKPDFTFSYWPSLDGLLHMVGNQSSEIAPRLAHFEGWIQNVCDAARQHYEEVHLYVFGDHGMANCDEHLDLKAVIEGLPLKMGRDYAVVYDSTMARFWFFNDEARRLVAARLAEIPQGRILPDDELRELRAYFPDRYFGEMFFLMKEGVLIVPSHMGERPIRAMHGYHPTDKHSYAALFSNQEIPASITAIPHMHQLMTEEALQAKAANQRSAEVVHA